MIKIVKYLLSIILFFLVLHQLDVKMSDIFDIYKFYFTNQFSFSFFSFILLLILLIQIVISFRTLYLIKFFRKRYTISTSFKYTIRSLLLSNFLFSFAGDIYKFYSKHGSSLDRTNFLLLMILEKMLAFSACLFIFILILIFYYEFYYYLLLLFLLLLFNKNNLNLFLNLPYINLYSLRIYSFIKFFLNFKKIFFIFGFSLLIQVISSYIYYLILNKFYNIDFIKVLFLVPVLNIILSIFFSAFSGIGVREFIMPKLFSLISINTLITFKASLLITFYLNSFNILCLVIFFLIKLVAGLGFEPRTFRL